VKSRAIAPSLTHRQPGDGGAMNARPLIPLEQQHR
jgi:hypothetical protein